MGEKRINISEHLLDLLYPRRCPICNDIIVQKEFKVCNKCWSLLPIIKEPRCKKCGKEVSKQEKEYCYDCNTKKHHFDEGIALFTHNKLIKNSIYQFKYHNKREYKNFYIEEILKRYQSTILSWNAEAFIPVPLYPSKKIKRGFNQAEVLAVTLAKKLELPVDSSLLIRNKETNAQKELNHKERAKNVENAFKLTQKIVQYKKVVLIDDIYTTGATIDSCSKELKKFGVNKVYFITISIGDGF